MAKKSPSESLSGVQDTRKWTADGLHGGWRQPSSSTPCAVRDLKEMELGCNDDVNVVVQVNRHWPRSAQRYEITSDGARLLKQLDRRHQHGRRPHARQVHRRTVVGTRKYLASNYCLVLWGHAFGIGFGRDENDALMLPELRRALAGIQRGAGGGQRSRHATSRLELLGTNACTMSYLEAAFELRDVGGR